MKTIKIQCCLWLFISIHLSMAANWYVDPAGSADPNGSIENPFPVIQNALDEAQSGDTIILKPGVYTGPGNYNLNPGGLALTIQSTDPTDPDIRTETIMDPNQAGRAFLFTSGEDLQCIIDGLTIRNALASDSFPFGGAVYLENSSPTIRNCIFAECSAGLGAWGGALYGWACDSRIENCLFTRNTADYGGALSLDSSQIEMIHCTIVGNLAVHNGGGLICDLDSSVILRNSILFFNSQSDTENAGKQVSARHDSVVSFFYSDLSTLEDDIEVINGGMVTLYDGTLHLDPNFAYYDPGSPYEAMDFHLRSRDGRWDPVSGFWTGDAVTSPCIDAGDPNTTWSMEPWPNGKRANMGYYGNSIHASKNGNPADFDIDGNVNLVDLVELTDLWLQEVFWDIHDLTPDESIDLQDFTIFSSQWLWQKP